MAGIVCTGLWPLESACFFAYLRTLSVEKPTWLGKINQGAALLIRFITIAFVLTPPGLIVTEFTRPLISAIPWGSEMGKSAMCPWNRNSLGSS
jgi:hypothetical protein